MSYLFTFSVRCLFTFQRLGSIDGSSTIGRSSSLSQEKQGIIQDNFEESKYRVNKTVWWTQHKNLLELASTYHFFYFCPFWIIFLSIRIQDLDFLLHVCNWPLFRNKKIMLDKMTIIMQILEYIYSARSFHQVEASNFWKVCVRT